MGIAKLCEDRAIFVLCVPFQIALRYVSRRTVAFNKTTFCLTSSIQTRICSYTNIYSCILCDKRLRQHQQVVISMINKCRPTSYIWRIIDIEKAQSSPFSLLLWKTLCWICFKSEWHVSHKVLPMGRGYLSIIYQIGNVLLNFVLLLILHVPDASYSHISTS